MQSERNQLEQGGSRPVAPILLGLLLVAFALRLVNYDQSLWFDEACVSNQRLGTLAQLLSVAYVDFHPPLFISFMHVSNRLCGDSEVVMRLFPLLCGLGGIVMIWVVGRRLVGSPAALWAALLLSLSPVHIWYSIEARPYSALLLGVLVLVWLFHRLLEGKERRRTWWAYGTLLFVLLALHYYLVVYAFLLALLGYVSQRGRSEPAFRRRLLIINGSGISLLAAWIGVKVAVADFASSATYLRTFSFEELYRFLFQWCWTGNCLPAGLEEPGGHPRWIAWVSIQVLGAALFAVGVFRILRSVRRRSSGTYTLVYLCALPALLLALPWLGFQQTYVERSALSALPFLFLVIGLGLSSLPGRRLRLSIGCLLLASCGANLVAYYAYDDEWTIYKPHPDWRSLTADLGAEIDAGAAGRPIFAATPNPRCLPYYDERIQSARDIEPTEDKAEDLVRSLEGRFGAWLGGMLADVATSIVDDFERDKTRRREAARMLIYTTGDGSLEALRLDERRRDGVFYLVQNRWHPPGDTTIAALTANPRLRVVSTRSYRGLTLYEMRELE